MSSECTIHDVHKHSSHWLRAGCGCGLATLEEAAMLEVVALEAVALEAMEPAVMEAVEWRRWRW